MIRKSNLKKILLKIGFIEIRSDLYCKKYNKFDYEMKVDFESEVLEYGDKVVVNDKTTSNFSHEENFVVFECVDRLIDMGYRPEDIELEPKWTLGHDAKGGKADIVVYDNRDNKKKNKLLFIIECKTYGKEYDKEYKNTLQDGGQLFSYLQQEKSAEWLIIYSSDIINDKIIYKTDTIKVTDDANILKLSEKDETILTYKNANNKEELFEVWDKTYEKRFVGDVIFAEDVVPYKIGIKPLKKKDLKDFTENDNIVNKFEEILRHNNVSDKENAFNRLIALFIAKLADELEKDDNDVVDFQYKVGTDTFETLQDRLQRLHKDGMLNFMNEEITYIDENYAENLVRQYTGQKRTKMIESLNNTIRVLKFYTNNDFAFKDVHNELLFMQNGQVLLEVVELFQNFRIIDPSQQNAQFLGDMFEQLLNQGFKQNEGQFFTPNQITRFVWESLPIEKTMFASDRIHYPKVIDFACGAGHFLVQGVNRIKNVLENFEKKCDLHPDKYFYGIEKDYRLARVSRVSLYMNDCGKGNIIFGDGLDNYKDKGVDNNKFDILVANPPYSVKEFKSHLKLYNNNLELLEGNYITNKGSEIETCFVERISQLLKPRGIGAVVLPSSLLNKDSSSFSKAREFIVYNFKIRAIVDMGSKTFGATGTNTIILFLEKYNEPPKRINLVNDSIEQIFQGNFNEEFEDIYIFDEYVNVINVDKNIYRKYVNKKLSLEEVSENKYFNNILNTFKETSEYKNKINQPSFKSQTGKEKKLWLLNSFYKYSFDIEKQKMIYVALTYNKKTLIITSPTENDEQEKFLGYKWSNRKGKEGIQIIKEGGKLYKDINNADDYDKIFASDLIKETFNDNFHLQSELLEGKYHYMRTVDFFDFSKEKFCNIVSITNNNIKFSNGFNVEKLKYLVKEPIIAGGDVPVNRWSKNITNNYTVPIYSNGVGDNALYGYTDICRINEDAITISARGTIGSCEIRKAPFYPIVRLICVLPDKNKILLEYLKIALSNISIVGNGGTIKQFTVPMAEEISIPVPNLNIQKKIVDAFDYVDNELMKMQKNIDRSNNEIIDKINNVILNITTFELLNNLLVDIEKSSNKIPKSEILSQGNIPVITQESDKLINGYSNTTDYISDIPVIVFGDHSCCLKYIDFNFVRGADGTQLIKTDDRISLKFLYYYLKTIDILNSDKYERHFKYLKNVNIPTLDIKKQNEFVHFAEEKEQEIQKLIDEKDKLLIKKQELINEYFK